MSIGQDDEPFYIAGDISLDEVPAHFPVDMTNFSMLAMQDSLSEIEARIVSTDTERHRPPVE